MVRNLCSVYLVTQVATFFLLLWEVILVRVMKESLYHYISTQMLHNEDCVEFFVVLSLNLTKVRPNNYPYSKVYFSRRYLVYIHDARQISLLSLCDLLRSSNFCALQYHMLAQCFAARLSCNYCPCCSEIISQFSAGNPWLFSVCT